MVPDKSLSFRVNVLESFIIVQAKVPPPPLYSVSLTFLHPLSGVGLGVVLGVFLPTLRASHLQVIAVWRCSVRCENAF